jgi:hypothetical protein
MRPNKETEIVVLQVIVQEIRRQMHGALPRDLTNSKEHVEFGVR